MRPIGPRIMMSGSRQPTPRFVNATNSATLVGHRQSLSPISTTNATVVSSSQQQQSTSVHYAPIQQPSQAIRQALNHPISSSVARSTPTTVGIVPSSSSTSHTPVPSISSSSEPVINIICSLFFVLNKISNSNLVLLKSGIIHENYRIII